MHAQLAFLLLLSITFGCLASGDGDVDGKRLGSDIARSYQRKVKVDVYYATLCEESIQFLLNQLIPNYASLANIMELRLIPFGKGEMRFDGDDIYYYCQHGPAECRGNQIQACAINLYDRDYDLVLPYIQCMEERAENGYYQPNMTNVGRKCASYEGLSWGRIEYCINGRMGERLLRRAGMKTLALRPQLPNVPTIVINKQFTDYNQEVALYGDFVALICDYYRAWPKPIVCDGLNYKNLANGSTSRKLKKLRQKQRQEQRSSYKLGSSSSLWYGLAQGLESMNV